MFFVPEPSPMDCQVRRAAHLRAVNARHQGNGNHRYCKSIHILSYKSTYLCMYAYICICICICRCRCICVYVNICISVYLYICIYVSMNICIYAIPYHYITFHIILTRTLIERSNTRCRSHPLGNHWSQPPSHLWR